MPKSILKKYTSTQRMTNKLINIYKIYINIAVKNQVVLVYTKLYLIKNTEKRPGSI